MKKSTLHKILDGKFDPSPSITDSIKSLNKSYSRAKKTIESMHANDEITFQESMDREFRYYASSIQNLQLKHFEDEQKKMYELRSLFYKEFGVDIWDEVLLNCKFKTLEEFYESAKLYVRNYYV